MKLIIKIERPVFYLFVAVLISGTLRAFKVLPEIFISINSILFFIIGLYYVPVYVFTKLKSGLHKKDIWALLSNFVFAITCGYMAIVPFIQIETLGFLGIIVGIINGVFYIYFQLYWKKKRKLFLRHFIVTLLVMTIVFMTF